MKIYYGTKPKLTEKDKTMFSRGKFECKALFKNSKGNPVVLSQCKDPAFPIWKVECGFSCFVFKTYDEAMDFCKGRYFNLAGKAV